MIGYLRLLIRLPLVVFCVLITLLSMMLCSLIGLSWANRRIMQLSFTTGALIVSLKVTLRGALTKERPLLLVSNHFSYLDLFAIGSKVPAAFTPKSEIAGWPVIGSLCRLAGCLFIDRRPSKTLENKTLLEQAKKRGDIISLFPEGTTNEGNNILPFRSSYFSLAEAEGMTVQPLSVVYTHLNGQPLSDAGRPIIGWYGDAEFFPHLLHFLKQKNASVTLVFHETLLVNQFTSRKEMAAHARRLVEQPFHALLPRIQLQNLG